MSIKYNGKRKVKPTHPGEILREDFMPDYKLNVAVGKIGENRDSALFYFPSTRWTSSLQPTAWAYFFRVASVGDCRSSERAVSSRVTAGALVPIFYATSA